MKRILLALTMSVSLPIYAGIYTVFSIDLLSLINHVGNKTISHVNTHKLSNDKILLIYNYPNHGIRIDGNPDNTDWNIDYNLMIIDYNGSIIYSEKNVNLADGDEKFDTNDGVSILKNGAFYIHSRGLDSYDIRDKMGFFYYPIDGSYTNIEKILHISPTTLPDFGTYESGFFNSEYVISYEYGESRFIANDDSRPYNYDIWIYNATNWVMNLLKISDSDTSNSAILSSQTSSGFNQDNFVLNWDSSSGTEYQIQSSTDLTNWVNVGSAIVGTGETMTWANHVTNSQAFYRVVED